MTDQKTEYIYHDMHSFYYQWEKLVSYQSYCNRGPENELPIVCTHDLFQGNKNSTAEFKFYLVPTCQESMLHELTKVINTV